MGSFDVWLRRFTLSLPAMAGSAQVTTPLPFQRMAFISGVGDAWCALESLSGYFLNG